MIRIEPAPRRPLSSLGRRCLPLALLAVVLSAVVFGSSASARAASTPSAVAAVPPGFVGVDADGPLFNPLDQLNFDQQTQTMTAAGVESIRVAFNWAAAQPYENNSQVPADVTTQYPDVNGVPTNFADTDAIVATAARHGITVLPTILYAASWDATRNPNGVNYPADPAPYAAYAKDLVNRYGPRGSFWSANPGIPKLPIRMWQIWNEPNIAYYWSQPFASGYSALLRAAHAAIKSADPGAEVMLAALTNEAWVSLGTLHGVGNDFDAAAVNGFTRTPDGVLLYLHLMRRAMNHLGYRHKPLVATELSWPSAAGRHTTQRYDFDVTQRGQARNIKALLPMLAQQRRSLNLTAFYYYTWLGDESPGHHGLAFDFAGLEGYSNKRAFAKPALAAFKTAALALELCQRKSRLATKCARAAKQPKSRQP